MLEVMDSFATTLVTGNPTWTVGINSGPVQEQSVLTLSHLSSPRNSIIII